MNKHTQLGKVLDREHENHRNLIAAAPELLEALRDALTVIEQDMSIVERNKKRDKVIAAINKAEGREG